jgi:hypothetical protein
MAAQNEGWRFKTATSGRWVWQRLSDEGDVMSQSELDFPLIEECAADAQRSGYPGVIAAYAAAE